MNNRLPVYPFDEQRSIGTISEVGPSYVKANLPKAAYPEDTRIHGYRMGGGVVGEFVIVECGDTAIFSRIISIRLPERERLTVEPELGATREVHPVGTVQLLTTLRLKDGHITGGISQYPRLGSKIYSAHGSLRLSHMLKPGMNRSSSIKAFKPGRALESWLMARVCWSSRILQLYNWKRKRKSR